MKQIIYQIDAFTDKIFSGNPAAICPLEHWLSDELMQQIAMENNLAETAFYVKTDDYYYIRWFTPTIEVDLCGHATLAAAYVIFNFENYPNKTIQFFSLRSGELFVSREEELLTLEFPSDFIDPIELTAELITCFNINPQLAFKGKTDYLVVFRDEDEIVRIKPNLDFISKLNVRGVIITAPGKKVDFVSRFFAPQSGINEDPVTGSAHTMLTPYWAKELSKNELVATQLSPRKGQLKCVYKGDSVQISGHGKIYMIGEIYLD